MKKALILLTLALAASAAADSYIRYERLQDGQQVEIPEGCSADHTLTEGTEWKLARLHVVIICGVAEEER